MTFDTSSDRDYNEKVEGNDIGEGSGEGEDDLREGEGLERKRDKRIITIKMPTNKEDDVQTSWSQKRKLFEAKENKQGVEKEGVEGNLN